MPDGKIIDPFSVEELESKFNVKAVPGKLSPAKGKYILTYGRKRASLDPGQIISARPLNKAIKGPVAVSVIITKRGPLVIIIDGKRIKRFPILCYYPVPDFYRRIVDDIRDMVTNKVIEESGFSVPMVKLIKDGLKGGMR